MNTGPGISEFTLLIDGMPAGRIQARLGFLNFVSWTGLDIGRDRGSPVSDYESPFAFTGKLNKVTVTMDDDQRLDGNGVGRAQLAREWGRRTSELLRLIGRSIPPPRHPR